MPPEKTRESALKRGDRYFFTGGACKNGHVALRLASNGRCRECCRQTTIRWDHNNPGKKSFHHKKWKQSHKDDVRNRRIKWAKENPQKNKESQRAYVHRNPDKMRAWASNRKARKLRASGTYKSNDIVAIRAAQKGRCAYCREKTKKLTVDHIISLANGGSNYPANLQLVCKPCNSSKGTRDPIEHARKLGRLL